MTSVVDSCTEFEVESCTVGTFAVVLSTGVILIVESSSVVSVTSPLVVVIVTVVVVVDSRISSLLVVVVVVALSCPESVVDCGDGVEVVVCRGKVVESCASVNSAVGLLSWVTCVVG